MADSLFGKAVGRGSKRRNDRRRELSRRLCMGCEQLETRNLLSASAAILSPMAEVFSPLKSSGSGITNPTVVGDTPAQIKAAYGFAGVTGTGVGQTIAVVDAYNDPNITGDLTAFDSAFGLPAASLKVESQTGSTTVLPATNADWATEISLDVEWAHAIAPAASILLVEAKSDNWSDLEAAVDYAKGVSGVSVVSMSWGGSEYSSETSDDGTFSQPGVSFVTSAGDDGSPASYPATSPNVLSVGGTTLNLTKVTSTGATYGSETAWSDGGGGISAYEKEPAYQAGVQTNASGSLVSPDVAWDADPNTGVAVYDTLNDGYGTGWIQIGGTSVGAPSWSGLLADANQELVAAHKSVLGANAMTDLFDLPSAAYHDITTGGNGTYNAGTGFDAVTGIGSPVASTLVSDLVNGVTGSPTGSVITTIAAITRSRGGSGGNGGQGGGGRGGRYSGFDVPEVAQFQTTLANLPVTTSLNLQQPSAATGNVNPIVQLQSPSVNAPLTSIGGGGDLLVGSDTNDDGSADEAFAAPRWLGRGSDDAATDLWLSSGQLPGDAAAAALSPEAVDRWFSAIADAGDSIGVGNAVTTRPDQSDSAEPAAAAIRLESEGPDSTSRAGMSLAALAVVMSSYRRERSEINDASERRWFRRPK
jgi:hypothetical protein